MSIGAGLYLIDISAWARIRAPTVEKRLIAILQAAAAATCLPLDVDDGRSARNLRDDPRQHVGQCTDLAAQGWRFCLDTPNGHRGSRVDCCPVAGR